MLFAVAHDVVLSSTGRFRRQLLGTRSEAVALFFLVFVFYLASLAVFLLVFLSLL